MPKYTSAQINIYIPTMSFSLGENEQYSPQVPQVPSRQLLSCYHDESYVGTKVKKPSYMTYYEMYNYYYELYADKLPSINPQSSLLLWWNLLVEFCIYFHFCEIPISYFFTSAVYEDEYNTPIGIGLNAGTLAILFIHICVVRPITGFFREGIMVLDPSVTISKYVMADFLLNLVPWLSAFAYALSGSHQFVYFKSIFYMMGYCLYKVDLQIIAAFDRKRAVYSLAAYRLFRLVFILLFVVLWLSCVYFAIDYHYYLLKDQYYEENLWLKNSICLQTKNEAFIDMVEVYSWYIWLNYAVYWTLQSITGVGYGDMTPRNPPQVVYCNIVVLFMTIAYSYFVNSVWEIFSQASESGDSKTKHMKLVRKYQKKYTLEPKLANRLSNYIYEIWAHGKNEEAETSIKDSLSEELRTELLLIRQWKFFAGIPLFRCKLDTYTELFQQIAKNLKENKFGMGEEIFRQGAMPKRMYSVQEGQVNINYANSKLTFKVEKTTSFGISDFLKKSPHSYSAVTQTFCKVTYLDYDTFFALVKEVPAFYEQFSEKLEDLIRNDEHELTGENCWVCSDPAHPAHLCIEYFQWMSEMRDFSSASARQETKKNKKSANQQRLFLDRRRTSQKLKVVDSLPLFRQMEVDQIRSYKNYRSNFSI